MPARRPLVRSTSLASARALVALGALVAAAVAPQRARAASPEEDARAGMREYFAGEKAAAPLLVGPGVASLGAGGLLLAVGDSELARGAAVPTLALGAVEAAVGLVLFLRTDAQVARLDGALRARPAALYASESRRIAGVRRDLTALLFTELALTSVGAGALAVGGFTRSAAVQGVGLAVALQASVLFVFDTFALARAERYAGALERLAHLRGGASAGAWSLGYGATF
ncbi:MAG TPA: hypothetical protein PLR99_15930 [Polyangiaceae bacterium]|nr:hypothetical protein [Polyangiaceae bacterium]